MNELNDLQNIWQSGKSDIKHISKEQVPGDLIQKLKKLQSFQDRINKIKVLFIAIVLLQLGYTFYDNHITSVTTYVGLGIFVISIVLFLTTYLRNQFNIRKVDFTAPSMEFATTAIQMLEKQNAIFKQPFLIFCILLTIGSNTLLAGLISSGDNRLLFHVSNTLILAFAMFMGYKIRMWRIKKEVTPIIDELKALRENLNSENE